MLGDNSTISELLSNPIGFDVIYKILLQMGKSISLVDNFVIRRLKIKHIKFFLKGKLGEDFFYSLYELLNQEGTIEHSEKDEISRKWWKEAVFYQIYPKSFKDSNGDGIGDLKGITLKLDYLKALGVDALWLCPIYDSPLDDNGYDIRDYKKVLKEFGTMEDFDNLVTELKKRNMRIILDLVVNHTSDEHEWFKKALADKNSKYHDYYIFKPNEGRAPNNWVSFFSGSAWRYVEQTDEYSLRLFSSKQMDLNWENENVRKEVEDIVTFWRNKGIDGFRLDVINYISKNSFNDGNETIGKLMEFYGVENYFFGKHLHDYLRELKKNAFGEMFSVGETPGVGFEMSRLLSGEKRGELDTVFLFDHLETPGHVRFDDYHYDLNYLKKYYVDMYAHLTTEDWPSLFFENHDNPRMISKVSPKEEHRKNIGKLIATFMLTLRGTPFIYQGQELGLINQNFEKIEDFRDVESINKYEELICQGVKEDEAIHILLAGSRDHARTCMPWSDGFTTGKPWIMSYSTINIDDKSEIEDKDSIYNWYKKLIALRKDSKTLVYGRVRFPSNKKKNYFSYYREDEERSFFIEINLSDKRIKRVEKISGYELMLSSGANNEYMEPYEVSIYKKSLSNR